MSHKTRRQAQHHHNCANSVSSYMPAALCAVPRNYGPQPSFHILPTPNSKHISYQTPSSWIWTSTWEAFVRNCNCMWLSLRLKNCPSVRPENIGTSAYQEVPTNATILLLHLTAFNRQAPSQCNPLQQNPIYVTSVLLTWLVRYTGTDVPKKPAGSI